MNEHIEITPDMVRSHVQTMKNGGSVSEPIAELQPDSFESDELPPEEIRDEVPQETGVDMLCAGKWFDLYPEKRCGQVKHDQDRYGKAIMVIVGDVSDLQKINVSDDFDQFLRNKNIGTTVIQKTVAGELLQPENVAFAKDIIKKSKVSIGGKAVARLVEQNGVADIQSAKEIFDWLNPAISLSEVQAYVWYKDSIGQRLSEQWYELSQFENRTETIEDWVRSGILCYFHGELLPQVLYLSGNIYERITAIVSVGGNITADAEHVQQTYGAETLANQISLINTVYAQLYSKRLIITGGDDDNSLIIKPISKIAKTFTVSQLVDFEQMEWWTSKGAPNWEKEEGRSWDKVKFESLSLADAFCFWLVNAGRKLDINGNITHRDIIYFYIQKRTKQAPSYLSDEEHERFKVQLERTKAKSASEGNRLFLQFLDQQLSLNDKVALETTWNSRYNNFVAPDYAKIPVAFNVTREFYGESPFEVKPEKREAVAFVFNEGSGCLAYDVGVGKTMSDIMIVEQFLTAGYSKRPVIVVPNQTFKQWVSEIKGILPHRKINALFNLGVDYLHLVMDENGEPTAVEEGSITVITEEGLKALGFTEQTESSLMSDLYDILNQGGAEELMGDKKKAGFREKLEGLIGRSLKGTVVPIETLGFDMLTLDEAHSAKKVFTSVKGEVDQTTGKRDKRKQYSINSGEPSDMALKVFMLSQYILRNNNYRNVVLLTATPFTNSPLEVFSMLSLVAYHQLAKLGINNINDFFDTFIDVDTDLVINHKLKPEYKQVIKGFNNLPSLQRIILRFFNKKDGEDVGVVRPNKIVIPYTKTMVNNQIVDLPEDERISCHITLSDVQKQYMAEIIAYAEGGEALGQYNDIDDAGEEPESDVTDTQSVEVNEEYLSSDDKAGVRAIKSMNYSRSLALSPYLYVYNRLGKPTWESYIETSPKLLYVMECIRSVKEYHASHNEPMSGQVIYMDRGIEYFPLIAEYLEQKLGFAKHEIGMIFSKGMNADKKRIVQDSFLGRRYNEATQEYENISDGQRIKVLIGSSSIKEGMNLQKKSTVLYNLFIDWNPTDMIQLQGRIWRQQNEFLNVRIVNPMMIDSIDIFMFQKLEEKTARINTIWSNDGRSMLRLDEMNPNEIKYALIKDPRLIAQIEVDEKAIRLRDEQKSNNNIRERLDKFHDAWQSNMQGYNRQIDDMVKQYDESKLSLDTEAKFKYLQKLVTADAPRDKDGLVMLSWFDNHYNRQDFIDKYGSVSPLEKPSKPYWMDYYTTNARLIAKELKDLLNPRSIQPEFVKDAIDKINFDNSRIDEQLEFLKSEDYVQRRVEEILEYRERNKIRDKSIPELVLEFSKLNHLLSEKRIASTPVIKMAPTKPEPPKGSGDIDEAIETLEIMLGFAKGKKRKEIEEALEVLQLLKSMPMVAEDGLLVA